MKPASALLSLLLFLPAMVMSQNLPTDLTDSNSTSIPDGAMEAYCQILLASPTPLPPDQIPWYCICSHCQGSQGAKGDRGDRGMPGQPGSPGLRGSPGFRGPAGFVGQPGIKGQKGDDGVKGDTGLTGLTGAKGDRGYKGEKGELGLEGPPGDQGPKGDEGVCPDACEASKGLPGPPGPPGTVGLRGLPGAEGAKGLKGAKGDSGIMGISGTNGVPGLKGDQGPKGDCNCTNGKDGVNGAKGDKGDQGPRGDQGPVGQLGFKGDKGELGVMGMTGPPGPCMPMMQSAFAAGLPTSFPSPDFPIVFSKVLYNVQSSYIPSMGIYVAPINGTYVFSFHISVYDRILKVGLFLNFMPVLKVTESNSMGTASQTVVLHLNEGDGVWMQVKDLASNGAYASDEASSIFSGYLLYPDSCDGQPDMGSLSGRDFGSLGSTPPPPSYNVNGHFSWDGAHSTTSPTSTRPTSTRPTSPSPTSTRPTSTRPTSPSPTSTRPNSSG